MLYPVELRALHLLKLGKQTYRLHLMGSAHQVDADNTDEGPHRQ